VRTGAITAAARVIGLVLLLLAIPELLGNAVAAWQAFVAFDRGQALAAAGFAPPPRWTSDLLPFLLDPIDVSLAAAVAVYLVLGARSLVRVLVRDITARCAGCGYPLEPAVERCPECGIAATLSPRR